MKNTQGKKWRRKAAKGKGADYKPSGERKPLPLEQHHRPDIATFCRPGECTKKKYFNQETAWAQAERLIDKNARNMPTKGHLVHTGSMKLSVYQGICGFWHVGKDKQAGMGTAPSASAS